MKIYFHSVFILFTNLLFLHHGYGQIVNPSITVDTFSSPNPEKNTAWTIDDVLKLNVEDILALTGAPINSIIANAQGGEVRIKVYYYDSDAPQGKRMLLYEAFTRIDSADYIGNSEQYNQSNWEYGGNYLPISYKSSNAWTWQSVEIKSAVMSALSHFNDKYHCSMGLSEANSSICNYSTKKLDQKLPIVIEATVKNATFSKFKIPGLGEFDADDILNLSGPVIEIKGSNYEVNPIINNNTFGNAQNRFTVTEFNPQLANSKITALFNDRDNPDCYLKIKTPGEGIKILIAEGQMPDTNVFHDLTLLGSGVLKIKDKDSIITTFDLYRVYSKNGDPFLKFTATNEGPFVVASAFNSTFKENPALPNNKLYHRPAYRDEVLVCAHRGIWNQVGSHNPPDFSGIAENTKAAYQLAIDNPYVDWIEFDGRRTKDGVFIAFHDESVHRITDFADDAACFSLDDINERDKQWRDEAAVSNPKWSYIDGAVNNLYWDKAVAPSDYTYKNDPKGSVKDLILRDYLGCQVKENGQYLHPLKLEDAFQWLVDQRQQGKHIIISVDYKDGLNYLDELYRLILQKDLEGQILLSVYARDYALTDYQNKYGKDFLMQIPLKPTFYEPRPDKPNDYGGNISNRIDEFLKAERHFVAGITINVNSDKDTDLINIIKDPSFASISNRMWVLTHYAVPFMASFVDNSKVTTEADCDPSLFPSNQMCSNLFWRADFDWSLNNGTTAFFSDDVPSLVEYLIAKGKKTRVP